MNMLKTFLALGFVALVVSGCAVKRVELDNTGSWTDEIVVRGIAYDNKGLPVIGAELARRPSEPGDCFTVVRLLDHKPVVSYDIAVKRQKPDFVKPFRTVYEWTGKGFKDGAVMSGALGALGLVIAEADIAPNTGDQMLVELAIIATPVTIGTVGGFVIGLADGIKQSALELAKVVESGEQAITCTTYDYDAFNRLSTIRMYTADRTRELVRTYFSYEDTGPVPVKATVKSLVEGKEREVK
jgi:YD repeat-containing protein